MRGLLSQKGRLGNLHREIRRGSAVTSRAGENLRTRDGLRRGGYLHRALTVGTLSISAKVPRDCHSGSLRRH